MNIIILILLTLVIAAVAAIVISALHDALRAIPEISEELTNIRRLLEKKEK